MSLTPLPTLGNLFLLMGYLVQPRLEDFCLVLLYPVLWKPALFRKEKEGEDLRGKGGAVGQLRGMKGGETMFRMYYMREESIFIKRKTLKYEVIKTNVKLKINRFNKEVF